jgi:hypothetical protein
VTCQLLPTSSETYSVLQIARISVSFATRDRPPTSTGTLGRRGNRPQWQSSKRSRVPNQFRQLVDLLPLSSKLPALFISPHRILRLSHGSRPTQPFRSGHPVSAPPPSALAR